MLGYARDPGGAGPRAWLGLELDHHPDGEGGKVVRRGQRGVMEKDLTSLTIPNKAEVTLCAQALKVPCIATYLL